MCYGDCVTRFEPGFNAVLGPNGTGKSTLVTAVVIGLAGDLGVMERQKAVRDLIRYDKSEAEVEISLHETAVVKCVIYAYNGGKCVIEYFINGKKVKKGQVRELARKLQIQTDNVCQFLPQDVVKNFPSMSEKEVS